MADHILVFVTLALALAMFLWGRWRYDLVALAALLVLAVAGVVPPGDAFAGFGHPAVVTVAAVLVISSALERSGVVTAIARVVGSVGTSPALMIPALTVLIAVASGFMNNVGALALLMPVAIRLARETGTPPSRFLMPLAFGSLLGGLATLIGTPSNIIIGTFRAAEAGEPFRMFDFTPVGAGVAVAGVLFISVVGWRLVPVRTSSRNDALFDIGDYLTELAVPDDSPLVGEPLEALLEYNSEVILVGLVRDGDQIQVPSRFEHVRAEDRIVVEVGSDLLSGLVEAFGLRIPRQGGDGDTDVESDMGELDLVEAVVAPNSRLEGRTAGGMQLARVYGINLLAVSRRGESLTRRPSRVELMTGDVVLLQGPQRAMADAMESLGCLPLAERILSVGKPRRLALAGSIFALSLVLTAVGVLEVQVALAGAALIMVVVGLIRVDDAYKAVDWPVIVLIAAMLPVGEALDSTGGADIVAGWLKVINGDLGALSVIGLLIVVVMALSNVVNNAAAAVVMAPIAVRIAESQGASIDPFLMAVAVGAALPVLTPIGHQSNVLVMGPGGYRFGDYWRLGVPLSILVVLVAPPLILWAWPL